jgi:pimeloyl-ACP methyl ester carboxylesterase
MFTETDVKLGDGRTLHVYDTGADAARERLVVVYNHGSPNVGEPPAPLLQASAERGIRWVSYDRPGYGGSTPNPGRNMASAAADVSSIADALDLDRFAVMGHSSGSAHALAVAALLPHRVLAALGVSGLAPLTPFRSDGLNWFDGLGPTGAAELRAATRGRAVLVAFLSTSEFDPEIFTPADHAALAGDWSWFNRIAAKGMENGLDPFVDDDLATVGPWGFDPAQIAVPTLLVHGGRDRMAPAAHDVWMQRRIPSAELWLRAEDGHISVLSSAVEALDWLLEKAGA